MSYKRDFKLLNSNIVYFDNGATTLKPKSVIKKMNEYYEYYPSNAHRGDYSISIKASNEYENVRKKVKEFINAKSYKEIIFTSGSTESLNEIIKGYFEDKLKENDEVLITKSEHASVILPWFDLSNKNNFNIKYIDLTKEYTVTLENVKKAITKNTKVITLSHISNVIGDIRPIKEIVELAHKNNILVVLDASQSIGHIKVDVQDLDVDFMAFSAHKMLGPTGVGVLYGKEELLEDIKPIKLGGGMNISFDSKEEIEYKELPYRLEAGTQNIAGVIGFGAAIDYINKEKIDKIDKTTKELRKYLIKKMDKLDNIKIYNKNIDGYTIIFNVNKVFAQDAAIYLDKKDICVRSGDHCDKKLKDELKIKNTLRISLYFYNTKKDCDRLIKALKNENILEESLGV
jgi:cysteine desulfurase/selenocysteine lyase